MPGKDLGFGSYEGVWSVDGEGGAVALCGASDKADFEARSGGGVVTPWDRKAPFAAWLEVDVPDVGARCGGCCLVECQY